MEEKQAKPEVRGEKTVENQPSKYQSLMRWARSVVAQLYQQNEGKVATIGVPKFRPYKFNGVSQTKRTSRPKRKFHRQKNSR